MVDDQIEECKLEIRMITARENVGGFAALPTNAQES